MYGVILSSNARSRRLQNDSKHSLLVGSSLIRTNRLSLGNSGLLTGERLGKGLESLIRVDVVHHQYAARPQDRPYPIQFETHVALTVQAVMNEHVYLAELRKQLRKAHPARSLDVGPSLFEAFADRDTDLLLPAFFQGRKVNAREMTTPVSLHRFKDNARSHPMADSGFDDVIRTQVSNQAPDRPRQSGIAIIPILEALGTRLDPLCLQLSHHL